MLVAARFQRAALMIPVAAERILMSQPAADARSDVAPTAPTRPRSALRRLLPKLVLAAASLTLGALVCLFAAEWLCRWRDPRPEAFARTYSDAALPVSQVEFIEPTQPNRGHVLLAPNLRWEGAVPWEPCNPTQQARVITDEWGFYSDVPYAELVKHKKGPDEFRIIVTGGSGAQGHGATCLEATFERVLEKSLNATLQGKKAAIRIRVYNLAVGGHFTEDNYHILHRFGLALDPDLLVFYVGPNDLSHTAFMTLPQTLERYAQKQLDTKFAWEGENLSPGYVQFCNRHFPYLGRKYHVFHKLGQSLTPDHYARVKHDLKLEFLKRWNISTSDENGAQLLEMIKKPRFEALMFSTARLRGGNGALGEQLYQKVPLPVFADSLKAVKRDFLGIPIVVAWQLITHQAMIDNLFDLDGLYDRFHDDAKARLTGYMNDDWTFLHMEKLARDRFVWRAYPDLTPCSFNIHLDDAGHRLVADILHDELLPRVTKLMERRH
jgi:hypothetical protein